MIEIEFHGAAKTVTGSNYLVKTDKATFIVDCGMFQGEDVEYRNLEDYEYNPAEVDFVLLTHAHIDHSGMLPKLYKHGFRGKIFATSDSIRITSLLLMDSAKIQENNYKSGNFYGKYTKVVGLVYNTADAEETINLFSAVSYEDVFNPAEGINIKYIRSGHILGAASIEADIENGNEPRKIIFSGDIGRTKEHLIPSFDLDYKAEPDYILMESLYGGQIHPKREDSITEMIQIINETMARGGNVYIPCFAVQRTQEILNDLKSAKKQGRIANEVPVSLDSPLAQKVSYIYTTAMQTREDNPFDFPNLQYIKKYKQSTKLHRMNKQIIVAGSGMADGGRIVDHLSFGLRNKRNSVVFVGYQAEGTLGRELVDGAKEVIIGKTKVPVHAKIHHLHGFSAHGDTNDYINWVQRFKSNKLKKVFMIHAEPERSEIMDKELDKIGIMESYIPSWKEKVTLE